MVGVVNTCIFTNDKYHYSISFYNLRSTSKWPVEAESVLLEDNTKETFIR